MKRVYWVIAAVLALAGIVWAGAYWLTAPLPPAPRQDQRFDLNVGAGAEQPHIVDYASLDARLQRLMQDPAMVGLAIGVVEHGQIRFVKGYGRTFAGGNEPVTPDTVFRWASLSKGVAADMVASLANDGRLRLTDPVNRWTSIRLPGGNEAVASVADMLSHTLGLFAHAQDAKLEDGMDPAWLRASLGTLHNICGPGLCHAYQNVAYDGASEVVERVTGLPYPQAVEERFFAPLGMRGASVTRAGLMGSPSWARPHTGGQPSRPEEPNDIYYRVPAAGGVNGSIKDLALWMRAQMGLAPEVLPPAVLRAVQQPRVRTPGENFRRRNFRERTGATAYGFGWRVMDYAGHRVIGHHGGVRGYRSMILFDPALKSGVVVLWNSSTSRPNGIEYEVMDMVYRLPFRDWLRLDEPAEGGAVPGNGAAENLSEGDR